MWFYSATGSSGASTIATVLGTESGHGVVVFKGMLDGLCQASWSSWHSQNLVASLSHRLPSVTSLTL